MKVQVFWCSYRTLIDGIENSRRVVPSPPVDEDRRSVRTEKGQRRTGRHLKDGPGARVGPTDVQRRSFYVFNRVSRLTGEGTEPRRRP